MSDAADYYWPDWLRYAVESHLEKVQEIVRKVDENEEMERLRAHRDTGLPGMQAWGVKYTVREAERRLQEILDHPESYADELELAPVGELWEIGSTLAAIAAVVRHIGGSEAIAETLVEEGRSLKKLGDEADEQAARWRSTRRAS